MMLPARLSSLAVTAGLMLACAHHRVAELPAPRAAPPPPSATTVSSDEIARERPTSIEQLLAGRLAGVIVKAAPGGGIIVRMMGPTSFYGSQEPLFIVDGVAVNPASGGTLSWLNPQDIESITALKNPSDIAIYGLRGANGVIVIKTKGSH